MPSRSKKSSGTNRKRRHSTKKRASKRAIQNALGLEQLEQRVCMSVAYAAAVNYNQPAAPDFVTTGDFNGDGRKDIVTSSFSGSNVSIMLGNTNGTFGTVSSIALTQAPDFVTSG